MWWWVAGAVVAVWAMYLVYRTGYRDGHGDGIEGKPGRRW